MTTPPPPVFTPFNRDEVIRYLGPFWPPRNNRPSLTLPPDATGTDGEPFTTGAVAVWPVPGRPGQTWWAVDGSVPTQPAGAPDQALADMVPGSVLVVPPPDSPPFPPS
ncbi:hypothetical protein [Actinacidiphila sp. ITFR-21]|uniref:hypothetical protein n=1 Tax=Actinacidiphila sp. ITFR-21 TaxID=3075199 RepID=UPI00288B753D|nr:hypothetical protein [Streptomyces sp. ITFR-21]WNI15575.1 hypothetical protein RLT57_08565 [Streptomyces sp. ITFR-21]